MKIMLLVGNRWISEKKEKIKENKRGLLEYNRTKNFADKN